MTVPESVINFETTSTCCLNFRLSDSQGIPTGVLVAKISEMLADEAGLKYFGKPYLQLLQKHILKPTSDLVTVKPEDWRGEFAFKADD